MSGIISRIGSNIAGLAARTTGLAAIGMTCYDAHVMGKLEADTYSQSNESARLTAAADNLNYMESPSVVLGKVKKKIFNFQVDNSFLMPFEAVYGYMRGFASSCVDKAIPLTMGLFALIGGKITSKLSAFGLMLYAGYKVLHEGFGIGKVNRLEQPYK